MTEENFKLTKQGYEKLKKQREELKQKLMGEIAQRIKEARELGDLSENSEYEEAKNEQGKIDSRIKEIDHILDHAEVIEDDDGDNSIAKLGKKVIIKDLGLNEEKEFMLVTPQEADLMNKKISIDSPIGKGILNKTKGEKVKIKTPNGKYKKIEIVDIITP
jgi:transcription elongation factor GreA